MEYNPQAVFIDIANRTLENIETVEDRQSRGELQNFNEITHLINGLLGLVVFIHEKHSTFIPKEELDTILLKDLGRMQGTQEVSTLSELVKKIRNAVAHASIRVHSQDRKITEIEFFEYERGGPNRSLVWSITMTKDQILKFVRLLTEGTIKNHEEYGHQSVSAVGLESRPKD